MQSPSQDINVVSLNIAGLPLPRYPHARVEAFCRVLTDYDATAINLQEVHSYTLFWRLRQRLGAFPFVSYKPGLLGPRAGLVTFSRRPLEQSAFFSLRQATRSLPRDKRPPRALIESLHKGVLISPFRDSRVVIMNAHLNPNADGDWSDTSRFYLLHSAQLEALSSLACERFRTSPVILSGDFNLARDCGLYTDFVRRGGWRDAFRDDFTPTFQAAFLKSGRVPHCIDYILSRDPAGRLAPVESTLIFRDKVTLPNKAVSYISDHVGLYGSLRFIENQI